MTVMDLGESFGFDGLVNNRNSPSISAVRMKYGGLLLNVRCFTAVLICLEMIPLYMLKQ